MKLILSSILVYFLVLPWSSAQIPRITISNMVLNEIDDRLFGQFLEKCSWGGETGGDLVINPATGKPDSAILKKLKAMDIPIIRYPGGTDVDYFPWTDLIDHAPGQQKREPYRAIRFDDGDSIVSDNRLGLNEFLTLCEELDAEPLYVLNIGDAFYKKISIQKAKENAAAVYAYCNLENTSIPTDSARPSASRAAPDWPAYRRMNGRDRPFNVKYFQIGNETWGFKGFDWKVEDHDEKAIQHLYDCIMAVADTLKTLNPEVQIIADGVFPQMNQLFEKNAKDRIDYLVFHSYQPWAIRDVLKDDNEVVKPEEMTIEDTWKAWVATPWIDPNTGMSKFSPDDGAAQNALASSFDIATTEWNWNGWYAGSYGKSDLVQPDLAKGLGAAGFLHALMRRGDKIKMACQSMLVGKSWGITAIRADPDYQQDPICFPSGQVTGLYSNYHGNKLLEVNYENIPTYPQPLKMNAIKAYPAVADLDILATKSDHQLFVHIINRNYVKEYSVDINLTNDLPVTGKYKRYTLAGDKDARIRNLELVQIANIREDSFENGKSPMVISVPPASVSVFVFELK